MPTAQVSHPNDFKVVKFTNKNDFGFTPEMGCMYDGRPIFGLTGAPGINGGESIILPFHIGHRLATNLAKMVQIRRAPQQDAPGNPVGKPLWSVEELDALKGTYIEELYSESKPVAQTETDRLMAKVEEYRVMVEKLLEGKNPTADNVKIPAAATPAAQGVAPFVNPETLGEIATAPVVPNQAGVFQSKLEVIAELERRQIKHDKRKSKADLENLLAPTPTES